MHVLLIPDGDRRYAKKNNLSLQEAYQKAALTARSLVKWMLVDNDIEEFTFFGLSYANVNKRSLGDLNPILEAQKNIIQKSVDDPFFHKNEIKISVCGEKHLLPKDYQRAIKDIEDATKDYTKRKFNLLLGYSGSHDFLRAIVKTIENKKNPTLEDITGNCMINRPVDFLIRTANEKRISDAPFFLMRYTEFDFIPRFFPELRKSDIQKALDDYYRRKRTFGI